MLHAVIMAGGSGTRFWPKSRRNRPKQLLRLYGDASMLQQTVERIAPDGRARPDLDHHRRPTRPRPSARSCPTCRAANVVAEPCPRDTAACVGLAASIVARQDPDGTMIVMPADHVIRPAEKFRATVKAAVDGASTPTRPPSSPSGSSRPGPRPATATSSGASRWATPAGSPCTRSSSSARSPTAPPPSGSWPRPVRLELRDLRLEGPGDPRRPRHPPARSSPRRSTGSAQALGTSGRGPRSSPANIRRWRRSRSTRP